MSAAAVKASDGLHLRSVQEVRGYQVQAKDGAIGRVEDFIVDDETCEMRYPVIERICRSQP